MKVKSVRTFAVILVKLATPPLPPKTKLNFEQNWAERGAFFGHKIAGGSGGDDGLNPKIVIWSRVLRSNYLKELFRTVPSSFVLHWRLEPLLIISPCKAAC